MPTAAQPAPVASRATVPAPADLRAPLHTLVSSPNPTPAPHAALSMREVTAHLQLLLAARRARRVAERAEWAAILNDL